MAMNCNYGPTSQWGIGDNLASGASFQEILAMNVYNSMIPESIDLNCKAISARTSPFMISVLK